MTPHAWRGTGPHLYPDALDRALPPARPSHGGMPLVWGEVAEIGRKPSAFWRAARTFAGGAFFFAVLAVGCVFLWAA